MFSRRDVVVAVAPALFGRDPGELDSVVDFVRANREVVPLVGVPGASERAYACASVIAVETAIAANVARGLTADRLGCRARPRWSTPPSNGRRPSWAGRSPTARPWRCIGICESGRRVDLVVGVAGSGKTTALACVRDAYEAAGYRVVGTSTSGQAARTLGREAGIAESRTLASLLWRLDHGRLTLDARTVVILDEAGMTADPDLLRVLVAAEAARAKVVLVGDDRQLGPVGPGGALGGLVERSEAVVHVLDENVRQADRGERRALSRLRAGDVDPAVDWYAHHGRIATAPTRTRRSTPWSTPGSPTPAPGSTSACTPGGGPTSPSSTSGPGPPGPPTATSPAPKSKRPAGAATPPATGSSPSPPAPTAGSSPANAASSNTPTQLTAAFTSAWTTAAATSSTGRRPPSTGSTTATRSPSTAPRAPPSTSPTASRTAAAGNSPTSR